MQSLNVASLPQPFCEGTIVVTKEPAPIKMGTKTLEVVPEGTELTVLDSRGVWLGVVGRQGDRENRGWVKARLVASPRVEIRVEEESLASAMDGIDWPSATVTADGKRIAYVVQGEEGSHVVVDGEPGGHLRPDRAGTSHSESSRPPDRICGQAKPTVVRRHG